MIQVLRETHEPPRILVERVARAGGWNCFGEPNFRVVWGWNRLAWIGGKWTDYDDHGNVRRQTIELRRVPKYFPTVRWHIERWTPPEAYGSPDDWYAQSLDREDGILIPALGPFPRRGEYEHCFTLQGPRGEFIPLTAAACEYVVRAIEWARRQRPLSSREAIQNREARIARDWEFFADALFGS